MDQTKLNEEIVANFVEEYLPKIAQNEESLMTEIKKDRNLIDGLLDIIRGIKNNLAIKFAKSEKAMLDEAERNLVNLLRSESGKQGNKRYSYGGMRADNAPDTFLQADRMRDFDYSDEDIRKETGWFKGADGKWRFEIDDSEMDWSMSGQYHRNPDIRRYNELFEKRYLYDEELTEAEDKELKALDSAFKGENISPKKLGDMLYHPELFKQYPELADVEVRFENLPGTTDGSYGFGEIVIDRSVRMNKEKMKSVLIHEIQHWIQDYEGFAAGSNSFEWKRKKERIDSAISIGEKAATKLEAEGDMKGAEKYRQQIEELKAQKEVLDGRSAFDLYQSTYGEQEARDVQARMNMSAEERKWNSPFTGDDNTVFAEGSGYYAKEQKYATRRDIEDYTEESYNNSGWTVLNNILSKREFATVSRKISELKTGTHIVKNKNGFYIIPTGNEFAVENKLVFVKGDINSFLIDKVITINLDNETDIEVARDFIYEAETGKWPRASIIIESYAEDGLLQEVRRGDSPSFYEYKQGQRSGGEDNQRTDTELQDRRGSSIDIGTDVEERYSRQIESYPYDGESSKSRGIRKTAVYDLADSLGNMFGITDKIGKEGLRNEAYNSLCFIPLIFNAFLSLIANVSIESPHSDKVIYKFRKINTNCRKTKQQEDG